LLSKMFRICFITRQVSIFCKYCRTDRDKSPKLWSPPNTRNRIRNNPSRIKSESLCPAVTMCIQKAGHCIQWESTAHILSGHNMSPLVATINKIKVCGVEGGYPCCSQSKSLINCTAGCLYPTELHEVREMVYCRGGGEEVNHLTSHPLLLWQVKTSA
jgi:hypothetical protein